jgi:T5SS/PEP-CTERM-associated repeat protein
MMTVSMALSWSERLSAADITWVAGDGDYETNSNWSPATVPTINDRAIFNDSAASNGYAVSFQASEALGNALFSAAADGVIWKVGANTWAITNSFTLDQAGTPTAIADFTSGTITVTNAAGAGIFTVGIGANGDRGLFKMELSSSGATAPVLVVDQLILSTNSDFTWRAGTVTTLHGSTINRGAQVGFTIGTNGNSTAGPALWNILGGTNTITFNSGGATYLGYLGTTFGGVTVSGPNTLWSSGGGSLNIGYTGQGALTISNGAQVLSPTVLVAQHNATSSSNNLVTVTGAGSSWYITSGAGAENSFGYLGPDNQTYVLNGGMLVVSNGYVDVGAGSSSSNNVVTVSGNNSSFQVSDNLQIGKEGVSNSMVIAAGGVVRTGAGSDANSVGTGSLTTGNSVLITGTGSQWIVTSAGLQVGEHCSGNSLTVSNGGVLSMVGGSLTVGGFAGATNNVINVAGGAVVMNTASINVGNHGSYNTLNISSNGTVSVLGGNLYISPQTDAVNNTVAMLGGSLAVTNSSGSAVLDVAHAGPGSFTFDGGTVTVDRLLVETNGLFIFASGVVNITATATNDFSEISSSGAFAVGDGVQAAVLNLGGGLFVADNGLIISANATLEGDGTVFSNLTVNGGGILSPGGAGGVGVITNTGNLMLGSGAILDYDVGTNSDQIVVNGNLTLNGTLNVFSAAGFGVGTNTLFTYTGTLTTNGSPSILTIGSTPNGSLTYKIDISTVGQVNLDVTGASNPFVTWQNNYFHCTSCPQAQPNADPYGKGISNTNQFLAGFNPTNTAAYLHVINVAKTNNNADVRVTYLGANGDSTYTGGPASRTNVLEFTTGTANGSYTNSFASTGQTNILSGGTGFGVVTNMVDSGGATNKPSRFYRVRVLLP